MPHHFQGKKRFKKREFFVPHQIWQNKWFEKREFFARRHFAPRRRFKKTLSFSNLGRKMVSRTYISRATTFSGIIWFNEWFQKRTFFVPQDSEPLQKLQVFRTLRSTTNDEPKSALEMVHRT